MFDKILVPLNGSEHSIKALEIADIIGDKELVEQIEKTERSKHCWKKLRNRLHQIISKLYEMQIFSHERLHK